MQGSEGHCDAGLHVEHARTVETATGLAEGHSGERAERPDRVEVAEEQDRLALAPGRAKSQLQHVAEVALPVPAGADSWAFRSRRCRERFGKGHAAVDRGLRVAGRFDQDE